MSRRSGRGRGRRRGRKRGRWRRSGSWRGGGGGRGRRGGESAREAGRGRGELRRTGTGSKRGRGKWRGRGRGRRGRGGAASRSGCCQRVPAASTGLLIGNETSWCLRSMTTCRWTGGALPLLMLMEEAIGACTLAMTPAAAGRGAALDRRRMTGTPSMECASRSATRGGATGLCTTATAGSSTRLNTRWSCRSGTTAGGCRWPRGGTSPRPSSTTGGKGRDGLMSALRITRAAVVGAWNRHSAMAMTRDAGGSMRMRCRATEGSSMSTMRGAMTTRSGSSMTSEWRASHGLTRRRRACAAQHGRCAVAGCRSEAGLTRTRRQRMRRTWRS
eukprot:SM003802S14603  [mRNA]  locus=s3802:3:1325:- [translate_table: standard]